MLRKESYGGNQEPEPTGQACGESSYEGIFSRIWAMPAGVVGSVVCPFQALLELQTVSQRKWLLLFSVIHLRNERWPEHFL
jgi:hypothetical protein